MGRFMYLLSSVLVAILLLCCSEDGNNVIDGDLDNVDTESAENNSDGDSEADDDIEIEPTLAEKLGITKYVGLIDPIESLKEDNVTTYTFEKEQGPICMRGDEYKTGIRDEGSKNLVIFLQGGGACWSEFCLAVTKSVDGVPNMNLFDNTIENNPVKGWNIVYLPYCDASFFLGDAEHDDNIHDLGKRYHHGLANLTASLEVAKMNFPEPEKLLLAGSSGGAYGLLLGSALVRHYYPDAEMIIMADSGIGISRENDEDYMMTLLEEFNLDQIVLNNCPDCMNNGHLTRALSYLLENDTNSRAGMFSAWYDSVLAHTFLQIPAEAFANSLKVQTDFLAEKYPERFRRFIIDGTTHTTLLGNPNGIIGEDLTAVELPPGALSTLMDGLSIGSMTKTAIGEVTIIDWLTALIDNDLENWVDIQEEPGEVPDWE